MQSFADKVAVVTGGASGIGRAVGQELLRHGARVVLADLNAEGAAEAARAMGNSGAVQGVHLDVTDADAVQRAIDDVVAEHGRLDYLFNNAGIAILGEARHMTLDDWTRLIDVNVRGVVHGVAAAYPLMIRQGFGHIVNTASVAGLAATPAATGYALTKHAVVGLSTSLRCEAVGFGVKVSVVCPGFINTPIVNNAKMLEVDREEVVARFPAKLHSADDCARAIVKGVASNRAVIVVTTPAKIAWFLYRLAPGLVMRLARAVAERSPFMQRHD
jgi:NAD(P)-dependent dehydrogenase (short-subunit alcohol dehydrogenase family)